MSVFGTTAAQSVGGLNQAEKTVARENEKKREATGARPKDKDSVDLAQSIDALRTLKGNDQEETHEDRQEHDHYRTDPGETGAALDVEG